MWQIITLGSLLPVFYLSSKKIDDRWTKSFRNIKTIHLFKVFSTTLLLSDISIKLYLSFPLKYHVIHSIFIFLINLKYIIRIWFRMFWIFVETKCKASFTQQYRCLSECICLQHQKNPNGCFDRLCGICQKDLKQV